MVSSGMLRRVALVRTDVSEELSASFNLTSHLRSEANWRACFIGRFGPTMEGSCGIFNRPVTMDPYSIYDAETKELTN
jgi:hypothetical protein